MARDGNRTTTSLALLSAFASVSALASCMQKDLDRKAPYEGQAGGPTANGAPGKETKSGRGGTTETDDASKAGTDPASDPNVVATATAGPAATGTMSAPAAAVVPAVAQLGTFKVHEAGSSDWFPAYASLKAAVAPPASGTTVKAISRYEFYRCDMEIFKKGPFLAYGSVLYLCHPGAKYPVTFSETSGGFTERLHARKVIQLATAGVDGATRSSALALEAIRETESGDDTNVGLSMSVTQPLCPSHGTSACDAKGESDPNVGNRFVAAFRIADGKLTSHVGSPTVDLIADAVEPKAPLDLSVSLVSDTEPLRVRVVYRGKEAVVPLDWRRDAETTDLRSLMDARSPADFKELAAAPPRVFGSDAYFTACSESPDLALFRKADPKSDRLSIGDICWKGMEPYSLIVFGRPPDARFTGFVARTPIDSFALAFSECSPDECTVKTDDKLLFPDMTKPLALRGLTLEVKWDATKKPTSLEVGFKDGSKKSLPFRTW